MSGKEINSGQFFWQPSNGRTEGRWCMDKSSAAAKIKAAADKGIRDHVKVSLLVTHPARVANSIYSRFHPIYALSCTISLYAMVSFYQFAFHYSFKWNIRST